MNAYRSHDRTALAALLMQLGCITVMSSGCKNFENGDGVVIPINFVNSIQIQILGQFNSDFKHAPIPMAIFKPPEMSNWYCKLQ